MVTSSAQPSFTSCYGSLYSFFSALNPESRSTIRNHLTARAQHKKGSGDMAGDKGQLIEQVLSQIPSSIRRLYWDGGRELLDRASKGEGGGLTLVSRMVFSNSAQE